MSISKYIRIVAQLKAFDHLDYEKKYIYLLGIITGELNE